MRSALVTLCAAVALSMGSPPGDGPISRNDTFNWGSAVTAIDPPTPPAQDQCDYWRVHDKAKFRKYCTRSADSELV